MTLSIDTFAAAAAAAVDCRPWPRFVLARADWQRLAAQPDPPLVALWANTAQVHGLFADPGRRQVLLASCDVAGGTYPALSPMRPGAAWFERVIADLWGHAAADGTDARGWLDHGRWPRAVPMAVHPGPPASAPEPPAFLPVPGAEEGGDLHQMPIGPVRQGIAEPGHLRLTCLGESVVRLEARLGYAHKGALVLLRGKSPRAAARYAARLSGDAAVAHAIAFAHATEAATDCPAPPRAAALRAVMAEMERIANHLGDLGAIGTAAGLATGPARLGYHREMLLRAAAIAFGHRLMMDVVVPGGIAADIAPGGAEAIHRALAALADALPALTRLPDAVAGQGGRLAGIGPVAARHAVAFAAGGPVARAAGLDGDARRWPGYAPYDALGFAPAVLTGGDADARVRLRFMEIAESLRLLGLLLTSLPEGAILVPLPATSGEGVGVAETVRGDAWHWLRLDHGVIAAAFVRDPGWASWPLLEDAMRNGDVDDLALCGASFGAAIAGMDL
jgi:Ni,Fe-hydrogenase III large subunit